MSSSGGSVSQRCDAVGDKLDECGLDASAAVCTAELAEVADMIVDMSCSELDGQDGVGKADGSGCGGWLCSSFGIDCCAPIEVTTLQCSGVTTLGEACDPQPVDAEVVLVGAEGDEFTADSRGGGVSRFDAFDRDDEYRAIVLAPSSGTALLDRCDEGRPRVAAVPVDAAESDLRRQTMLLAHPDDQGQDRCQRGGIIEARVRQIAGQFRPDAGPITCGQVGLFRLVAFEWELVATAETDANGLARFTDLPRGQQYGLRLADPTGESYLDDPDPVTGTLVFDLQNTFTGALYWMGGEAEWPCD